MAAGYTKGARMTDTNTGWRKRQIALDIKAENARELGLDYEPDKTVIEMAQECGLIGIRPYLDGIYFEALKDFAALVREDERNRTWTQEHWTEYERSIAAAEREACARIADSQLLNTNALLTAPIQSSAAYQIGVSIRARGQA